MVNLKLYNLTRLYYININEMDVPFQFDKKL